jgi:SAM-dependent methyltransferase
MKLDLGCGNKRRPGYVGFDRHPCEAASVLGELLHLPFKDDCAEELFLDNVIEHVLDIPALMREVLRVAAPGARIVVLTPHFSAVASWRDPTHVHHLSYFSMDHFEKPSTSHYVRGAAQGGGGFVVRERKLSFAGGPLGWIAHVLFALSPKSYETHYCFLFRASTLRFVLEARKTDPAP